MASCGGHYFFLFIEGAIRDEGAIRGIYSLRLLQSRSTSFRTAYEVCGEVKLKSSPGNAGHTPFSSNPQSNPQGMVSCTTSAYFGNPRGLVSYYEA
jgi:hypothetical protein